MISDGLLGTEKDDSIRSNIKRLIEERQPSTVRELVRLVRSRYSKLTTGEVIAEVRKLSVKGDLVLKPPSFKDYSGFFINFRWNSSFWLVTIAGILAAISFYATSSLPWSLLRLPMVVLILFYFPGRALLLIVSPRSEFTLLEKTLLEFATSLVILFLVGLFLNFSRLGFFALPTVSSMFLVDFVLALGASYKFYSILKTTDENLLG